MVSMSAALGVLKTRLHKNRISKAIKKWHREFGHSKETKNRISTTLKGKYLGDQIASWKGDKASYQAKHSWMYRHYGKANYCENDITHTSKRFEWANISGRYLRSRSDYKSLCVPCHRRMDLNNRAIQEYRDEIKKEKKK